MAVLGFALRRALSIARSSAVLGTGGAAGSVASKCAMTAANGFALKAGCAVTSTARAVLSAVRYFRCFTDFTDEPRRDCCATRRWARAVLCAERAAVLLSTSLRESMKEAVRSWSVAPGVLLVWRRVAAFFFWILVADFLAAVLDRTIRSRSWVRLQG